MVVFLTGLISDTTSEIHLSCLFYERMSMCGTLKWCSHVFCEQKACMQGRGGITLLLIGMPWSYQVCQGDLIGTGISLVIVALC